MTAYKNTEKTNWSITCCTLMDSNQETPDCTATVLTTRPRRLVIYYKAFDDIIFI